MGARSSAGAFAIKYLEITNLDLDCYYAPRCPTPGPPRVAARVTGAACPAYPADGSAAPAWAQAFGRLGNTEVGVIHVPFVNEPGQVFRLAITPPAAAAPAWTLTFLEQTGRVDHPQGVEGLGGDAALLPEIQVEAFLGYQGNRHSGYFAVAQPTTPTSYLPSIFFAVDLDGTVTRLGAAAFTAGTIGPEATVKAYVPAPPYPPTATPGGAPPLPKPHHPSGANDQRGHALGCEVGSKQTAADPTRAERTLCPCQGYIPERTCVAHRGGAADGGTGRHCPAPARR